MKRGESTLITSTQHHTGHSPRAVRHTKEEKVFIGKEEVKLSLFTGDMVLYMGNAKESTKKLLKLLNEF